MERQLKKAKFHQLSPDDHAVYRTFAKKVPGDISSRMDFAFMNIWNEQARVYIRETEHFVLLMMYEVFTDRLYCFPPLGEWDAYALSRPLETYRSVFKNLGRPFLMDNVSEWMLPKLQAAGLSRVEIKRNAKECDCLYMAQDYVFSLRREQTSTELARLQEMQALEWLDYSPETHDVFMDALCTVYRPRLRRVDCPSFFTRMLLLTGPLNMTVRLLKSGDTLLGIYAVCEEENEIGIMLCYAAARPKGAEATVRQAISGRIHAGIRRLRLSGVYYDGSLIAGVLPEISSEQTFNYLLTE